MDLDGPILRRIGTADDGRRPVAEDLDLAAVVRELEANRLPAYALALAQRHLAGGTDTIVCDTTGPVVTLAGRDRDRIAELLAG
jgi:hypothetical protein